MSSAVATKTSKYSYRSTGGAGGTADVSIEYSADLSALNRLEVSEFVVHFSILFSILKKRTVFQLGIFAIFNFGYVIVTLRSSEENFTTHKMED